MIASHYAEPLERVIGMPATLRTGPTEASAVIRALKTGEPFALLDDSLGWAWGYAGAERRVGYVSSGALAQSNTERSQTS